MLVIDEIKHYMLTNAKYQEIRVHNMLTYLKGKEYNEKKRIADQIDKAIRQMTVISDQSPDDLVEELIPIESILILLRSLLRLSTNHYDRGKRKVVSTRVAELSADLVEIGIQTCIKQNRLLFREVEALGEPIVTYLKKVVPICRDVAYQVELLEQNKIEYDNKLRYLFNWRQISDGGKFRLSRYLQETMEMPITDINVQNKNDLTISFTTLEDISPMKGSIKVVDSKSAILSLSNENGQEFTDRLIIKEHGKNKYVYGTSNSANEEKWIISLGF